MNIPKTASLLDRGRSPLGQSVIQQLKHNFPGTSGATFELWACQPQEDGSRDLYVDIRFQAGKPRREVGAALAYCKQTALNTAPEIVEFKLATLRKPLTPHEAQVAARQALASGGLVGRPANEDAVTAISEALMAIYGGSSSPEPKKEHRGPDWDLGTKESGGDMPTADLEADLAEEE